MSVHSDKFGTHVIISDIVKTYGVGNRAVDGVSLDILPGEFVTLLGPSGSGKTTTLNAIAGFVELDRGSIQFDGVDISSLPPHRRGVGMVFQHFSLFPHMTVRDNIGYPLRQRKVGKAEASRLIEDALGLVRLEGYGDRMPSQLSGGQQQRVAVARALVFKPRVLLMDEPFGALDKKLREELQVELRGLHRKLGVTIIFVTHDQEEALLLSDKIAVFDGGSIRQVGTPQDIYQTPKSAFVAGFLGDSNLIKGSIEEIGNALTFVADSDDFEITCGPNDIGPGPAFLFLRPDRMQILSEDRDLGALLAVRGRIEEILFAGGSLRTFARTQGGERLSLRVDTDAQTRLVLGAEVLIGWSSSDCYFLPVGQ